jgi:Fic family protein
MMMLEQINDLKAQLDRYRPLDPAFSRMLRENYRVRLTYSSTAIEGNTLTESETQVLLEYGLTVQGKPLKHHLEAEDHAYAFDYMEQLALGNDPIHQREIRELHTLVCKRADGEIAGRYRTINVMAAGSGHRYPEAILVPELMTEFDQWLNAPTDLHPVDFAAEAHYRLVTIHPFTDGNGRVARLLMNLLLLRAGYPLAIIQVEDRLPYIESIMAWRAGDDTPLKTMVRSSVTNSLTELLSLIG